MSGAHCSLRSPYPPDPRRARNRPARAGGRRRGAELSTKPHLLEGIDSVRGRSPGLRVILRLPFPEALRAPMGLPASSGSCSFRRRLQWRVRAGFPPASRAPRSGSRTGRARSKRARAVRSDSRDGCRRCSRCLLLGHPPGTFRVTPFEVTRNVPLSSWSPSTGAWRRCRARVARPRRFAADTSR